MTFLTWLNGTCQVACIISPGIPLQNVSGSGNSFALHLARIMHIMMQIVVSECDEIAKNDYCDEFQIQVS